MQVTTLIDIPFASEPVSLTTAAAYCKIDVPVQNTDLTLTSEGELLKLILISARQWCEGYTQKSFGAKTLKAELTYADYLERDELPYGPNVVITKAIDENGVNVTATLFSSTNYYTEYLKGVTVNNRSVNLYDDLLGDPPFLYTHYSIEYTAGYTANTLPSGCKLAILKTCLEHYNNRENSVIGTIVADLPHDAKTLLNPHRAKLMLV